MPTLDVDTDLTIEYDCVGEGPAVLLIPGLGSRRMVWTALAQRLARRFRVYSYDLRGYAGKAPAGQFTIADLAEDAARFLEALGIADVRVIGHSQGGFIALELCLARPKLVEKLILAASASYTDEYGRNLLRHWRTVIETCGQRGFIEDVFLWLHSPTFYNEAPHEAAMFRRWALASEMNIESYLRHNRACESHEARDRAPNIRCQTLLLGGRDDIVMGLRHNRLLKQLLPNAECVTIDGLPHNLFMERPGRLTPLIESFLLDEWT